MAEVMRQAKMDPKQLVRLVLEERDQHTHPFEEDELSRSWTGIEYGEKLLEELREAHFKRPKRKVAPGV